MTPVLRFQKRFVVPILDGRKTQTLRKRVPRTLVPEIVVFAYAGYNDPPFAELEVIGVEDVPRPFLTRGDVKREGLTDRDELIAALEALYPGVEELVRVRFRVFSQ